MTTISAMDAVRRSEDFANAGVWGVTSKMIRDDPDYWSAEFLKRMQRCYRHEIAKDEMAKGRFDRIDQILSRT